MKPESIYERRQAADRMETVMLMVAAVAVVGSIFALARYGWLPCLELLILGSLAFGLSRLFDLIGGIYASIQSDQREKAADKSPPSP